MYKGRDIMDRITIGRRIQVLALVACAFCLVGCAANSYKVKSEYEPAIAVTEVIGENTARIVFYRIYAFAGRGVNPPIYLDDKVVGQSYPGTMFIIDTAPGAHLVMVPHTKFSIPAAMLGGGVGALIAGPRYIPGKEECLDCTLAGREVVYIKTFIRFNMSGRTDIAIMDPEVAREEVRDLRTIRFKSIDQIRAAGE